MFSRDPKTILHLCSTSGPGGAEMIVNRLATGLDREQYRSVVCLFRPGWLLEKCENAGIQTHVVRLRSTFDWKWLSDCLALVKKERVSLIHAHEFGANIYGLLLARIARIPIVATVHGKNYYPEKWWRLFAYRILSWFGSMIAVSKDVKMFLIEKAGISERAIRVLYNGIPIHPLISTGVRESMREALGVPSESRVIGAVGSLYPVKGHKYLLDAMPKIVERFPDVKLIIAGTGELEGALKEQSRSLGLDNHVLFLGLRSDVPCILSILNVFVMPSLSEGLSLALLEAMTAAKPIVATNVGGNAEVMVDGVTGFLVPPCDGDSLAKRILAMLEDPQQAEGFGLKGRERAAQQFSLERMIVDYQEIYNRLLLVL